MGQRRRDDEPGSYHSVTNRGIARRPVFLSRAEVRYFFSRLARVHRRGLIEIHAVSVLTTHFHLLVRSPVGELSHAMRIVLNEYVRWFNRRNRRDGPLFRGRFRSTRIVTEAHWRTALRYIDQNAVDARLVFTGEDYPYGSATFYARPGPRPRWLTRSTVERIVCRDHHLDGYAPESYRASFGMALTEEEAEFVRLREEFRSSEPDPLDDLLGAAPAKVRAWFRRKTKLADATELGIPILSWKCLVETVAELSGLNPDWHPDGATRGRSGWEHLIPGLARQVCGLRYAEICSRIGVKSTTAERLVAVHLMLIADDPAYVERALQVLTAALEKQFDPIRGSGVLFSDRKLGIALGE